LGVALLVCAFIVETALHASLPIALYGAITGLLGLDILADALDRLRPSSEGVKK
jgi:hypothetical protein